METTSSPWWYRARAILFGCAYAFGFFLGYLSLDDVPHAPAFVAWGAAFGDAGATVLAWAGVAFALAGWALRWWGTSYLRRDVVFSADALQDRLVVAGPFRYVRNPLYLGNILMAIGIGCFAAPLGFAIIVLGNAVLGVALAGEEARRLRERYGAAFDAYATAVPAFVPRLTPASVPGNLPAAPVYGAGFAAEAGLLLFVLALVPVAAAGRAGLPLMWAIMAAGIAGFSLTARVSNTRGSAPRR